MPELWTVMLAVTPITLGMYLLRGWPIYTWFFWNAFFIAVIAIAYLIEYSLKK